MRKLLLVLACLSFYVAGAQESDVRKAIDTFFEGFHARDTVKMKSVFAKNIVMHSVSQGKSGSKLSVETAAGMCHSIASIPDNMQFEEKLLGYNTQIDGLMAHVWMPYEFYVNGTLSHSGVNSFQLFKDNGVWKIAYCMDTRKRL